MKVIKTNNFEKLSSGGAGEVGTGGADYQIGPPTRFIGPGEGPTNIFQEHDKSKSEIKKKMKKKPRRTIILPYQKI